VPINYANKIKLIYAVKTAINEPDHD